MSNSKEQLKRAYKLIKRDKTAEAQAIIRPILEAEPDNAQAWWLLAHTVEEPGEVRTALNKMLSLDPQNSNAAKARELLVKLDEQYPAPTGFEDEEIFTGFSTPELTTIPDIFAGGDDFEALDAEMFPGFDAATPEPAAAPFETPQAQPESNADIARLFQFEEAGELDDEAKAALEEKAGRRPARRGRRLLRVALILLLIPLIAIAILVALLSGGDEEKKDPGALAAAQVQSEKVSQAVTAAESDLNSANLGSEKKVIIAQSPLGNTLFVEFCSQPAPDMPALIAQGMTIAAQQAPTVQDDLAAVGVSVNLCSSTPHDTLYRVSAPVKEAVRFLNGDFGEGETGLAGFQATWKTS